MRTPDTTWASYTASRRTPDGVTVSLPGRTSVRPPPGGMRWACPTPVAAQPRRRTRRTAAPRVGTPRIAPSPPGPSRARSGPCRGPAAFPPSLPRNDPGVVGRHDAGRMAVDRRAAPTGTDERTGGPMDTSPLPSPLPIVQAPMAGGPSTPELTASVGRAGGFGFLAAGYRSPDQVRASIAATCRLTDAPFGVNVFFRRHPPTPDRSTLTPRSSERSRCGWPRPSASPDGRRRHRRQARDRGRRPRADGELHVRLPHRRGGRHPAHRRLLGGGDRDLGGRGPRRRRRRAPTWWPCRAPRPAATRVPSSATSRTGYRWAPSSRKSGGPRDCRSWPAAGS